MSATSPFLRGLLRRQEGTATIEMALATPIFAMLMMGMVDTSLAIAQKLTLEGAAQRAVEKATAYGSAGSDYSDLVAEAAEAAGVDAANVVMDKWLSCDDVRQDYFTDVCDAGDEISRHIRITVNDTYEPFFNYGPIGRLAGAEPDGLIPLAATAEVRIQ